MSSKCSTKEYDPLGFNYCTSNRHGVDDLNVLNNTLPKCSVYPMFDIVVNNTAAGPDLCLAAFFSPTRRAFRPPS